MENCIMKIKDWDYCPICKLKCKLIIEDERDEEVYTIVPFILKCKNDCIAKLNKNDYSYLITIFRDLKTKKIYSITIREEHETVFDNNVKKLKCFCISYLSNEVNTTYIENMYDPSCFKEMYSEKINVKNIEELFEIFNKRKEVCLTFL